MNSVNRFFIVIIVITVAAQFQGCLFVKAGNGDIESISNGLGETQTELFFGLSKPDGSSVTEEEWGRFVDDYISPKFKDSFTIVDARGQWMDNGNKVVKENSKLVIIIYKRPDEMDSSLNYLIENYKKMFQQTSVLKVTLPVRVEE